MPSAFGTPVYSGTPTYSGYKSNIIPGSAAPGTPPDNSLDYGLYDASTGKVISRKTRKPWSGKEPRSGKMFTNGIEAPGSTDTDGVEVPYSGGQKINPNDPNQRYQSVDIIKDPAIAQATQDLLSNFKQSTADALKGFDDYLNQFKADSSAALTKGREAVDIEPTINRLNQYQSGFEKSLASNTAAHNAALDKSAINYEELNNQNADTQRGIVKKQYDEMAAFDASAKAIGDRQMQEVIKNLSRYKLASGVPTGLGTEESKILAQGAADVMLPLEQAKINKRYDLYGNEANVEHGIYGTEQNRVAAFDPFVAAQEFAANQGAAMQQFQSGQATTQTIQSLKERIANMSIQQAIQFFDLIGVPAQLRQQILGGQIAQLGALGNLNEMSRYRGLQDRLGVNLSQPQGAGFSPNYNFTPAPRAPTATPPYIPPMSPTRPSAAGASAATRTATLGPDYGYAGESGYVNSRYNPAMGGLDLGPDNQFFRTVRNPSTGAPMSVPVTGNVNLPLDYNFGRDAERQREFAAAQAYFEGGGARGSYGPVYTGDVNVPIDYQYA